MAKGSLVTSMRTLDTRGPPVSSTLAAVNPGLCCSGPFCPQVTHNCMESIKKQPNEEVTPQRVTSEAEMLQHTSSEDKPPISFDSKLKLDVTNHQPTLQKETMVSLEAVKKIEIKKKKRPKLSGAGKKRLRWLLKSGVPVEKAREKAALPLPRDRKLKRSITEESSPRNEDSDEVTMISKRICYGLRVQESDLEETSTAHTAIPKNKNVNEPKPKVPLKSIKVGIMLPTYPEESLTSEQMKLIENAILERVLVEGETFPHFNKTAHQLGWLKIYCADKETVSWLLSVTENLKPWEGANLKAVEEKNMQKLLGVYLLNSQSDSTEKILKLIRAQNSCLDTAEWRLLKRNDIGTIVHLLVSVDLRSLHRLKETNYRIYYKFGNTTMKQIF